MCVSCSLLIFARYALTPPLPSFCPLFPLLSPVPLPPSFSRPASRVPPANSQLVDMCPYRRADTYRCKHCIHAGPRLERRGRGPGPQPCAPHRTGMEDGKKKKRLSFVGMSLLDRSNPVFGLGIHDAIAFMVCADGPWWPFIVSFLMIRLFGRSAAQLSPRTRFASENFSLSLPIARRRRHACPSRIPSVDSCALVALFFCVFSGAIYVSVRRLTKNDEMQTHTVRCVVFYMKDSVEERLLALRHSKVCVCLRFRWCYGVGADLGTWLAGQHRKM